MKNLASVTGFLIIFNESIVADFLSHPIISY